MILAKSPLRVSFFGGGSDIPAHYLHHGGATISTAIDMFVYVAVMPTPHKHIKIDYSKRELVYNVDDIQNDIVRNALKHFNITSNIEITSFADIPTIGTGLGGSSAFTCALVAALAEYSGFTFGPYDIAEIACHIEISMCGWNIGKQDQYASAFGGLNYIQYGRYDEVAEFDGSSHPYTDCVFVSKLPNPNEIERSCILVPTETTRHSSDIISSIDFKAKTDAIKELTLMANILKQSYPATNLYSGFLDKAWNIKRSLSPEISNPELDELVIRARKSGGHACKLLGAGGGGYMLVMAAERAKVKKEFSDRICLEFNIAEDGTKVVYRD